MSDRNRLIAVTVAVPVKNEGSTLEACLARLYRFAEVVVIDSNSADNTRQVAEKAGARVLNFEWDGRYPKKRNWFLLNSPPTQPWVLFLDADEFIDDDFCDALEFAIEDESVNGYWLEYSNHFMGKLLRHGLPQRKLALFKVGKALYEKIEEDNWSHLDMEIHEHPIVNGVVKEIKAPIEHRDDRGISVFLQKHIGYAQWEARRSLSLSSDKGPIAIDLTPRQRFKYKYITKWWYSYFYFIYTYIVRFGCLDGGRGLHYALYKAWYFRTIRLLILEYKQADERL